MPHVSACPFYRLAVSRLESIASPAFRTVLAAGAMIAGAMMASLAGAQTLDVLTAQNDAVRSGVQSHETILRPTNVNTKTFGKLFRLKVLGDVYAQPLFLQQYTMADGKPHNVLIVATAEDYVYAFDADGKNPSAGYLWRKSLLGKGETFVSSDDVNSTDIQPNIGIIGTPAIDRTAGIIYAVAKSKTAGFTFIQRLHALNIADGTEKLNGPTLIQASVPGIGDGGSTVSFDPLLNNQRPALLLAPTPKGVSASSVVIAWASHGDNGLYHGWVIAYDAQNIAKQTGVWADTANGSGGGIWMTGGGLSTDGAGNIFGAAGNGVFDANTHGKDYGDSAFRLTLTSAGLKAVDYFTPADQSTLNQEDADMGTVNPVLLPTQTGKTPHLMITADKSGTVYLLNRDKLGDFTEPGNSSLESFSIGTSIHGHGAFFNNAFYIGGDDGSLEDFPFDAQTQRLLTSPRSQTAPVNGFSILPSISANGTQNGIVWGLDNTAFGSGPAILHAYDPANLGQEYYNSTQAKKNADAAAGAVKFTNPTIANGKVYVGGSGAVTVYGLKP